MSYFYFSLPQLSILPEPSIYLVLSFYSHFFFSSSSPPGLPPFKLKEQFLWALVSLGSYGMKGKDTHKAGGGRNEENNRFSTEIGNPVMDEVCPQDSDWLIQFLDWKGQPLTVSLKSVRITIPDVFIIPVKFTCLQIINGMNWNVWFYLTRLPNNTDLQVLEKLI